MKLRFSIYWNDLGAKYFNSSTHRNNQEFTEEDLLEWVKSKYDNAPTKVVESITVERVDL